MYEGGLASVLHADVVVPGHVPDEQVDDTDVHGHLQQEADILELGNPFSGEHRMSMAHIGQHVVEPLGEMNSEDPVPADTRSSAAGLVGQRGAVLVPIPLAVGVSSADEMHTQHLAVVEGSEDSSPDSSEEQDEPDGPPVLVLCVFEAVGPDDYERDRVAEVSDHVAEEQGQEDGDQDGRVDLLVLGHVDHGGRILELADYGSVVLLGRDLLEAGFRFLGLIQGPSAGLLELHIDVIPELLLEVGLDRIHLLGGDPGIHDVGVFAHRDPERDGPFLDLDGQFFVASFEERHVFRFEGFELLARLLDLGGLVGDLGVDFRDGVGGGNLPGLSRDGHFRETEGCQGLSGLGLASGLEEHRHNAAGLLVVGREDLGVRDLQLGRVLADGPDDDIQRFIAGILVEGQRKPLQNLVGFLFGV